MFKILYYRLPLHFHIPSPELCCQGIINDPLKLRQLTPEFLHLLLCLLPVKKEFAKPGELKTIALIQRHISRLKLMIDHCLYKAFLHPVLHCHVPDDPCLN